MNNYIYSALNNAFYPLELREVYENAGTWPEDGLSVDDAVFSEFSGVAPVGKTRAADAGGLPRWEDIPPPSTTELVAMVEAEKHLLIEVANGRINSRQWPSKLALGRLSEAEVAEFNTWLDYLDKVEAVDITAPIIEWPTLPEVLAN